MRHGLAFLALVWSMLAVSLMPAAEAHSCKAEDPEETCGECREVWYDDEDHRHLYTDGTNYCSSGEGCQGDAASLVDLSSVASLLAACMSQPVLL